MRKSTRNLFATSSIISFIISFMFGAIALLLLFGEATTTDIFTDICSKIMPNISKTEIDSMMTSYLIFCAFTCYDNYSAGKVYLFMNKAPEMQIEKAINSIPMVCTMQLIFGLLSVPPISLIAPIIGFIAISKTKKDFAKRIKIDLPFIQLTPNDNAITLQPQVVQLMLLKIQKLKAEKSKGLYTDEQYNQKLSKILGGDFS